jgi:hypothetical protein
MKLRWKRVSKDSWISQSPKHRYEIWSCSDGYGVCRFITAQKPGKRQVRFFAGYNHYPTLEEAKALAQEAANGVTAKTIQSRTLSPAPLQTEPPGG